MQNSNREAQRAAGLNVEACDEIMGHKPRSGIFLRSSVSSAEEAVIYEFRDYDREGRAFGYEELAKRLQELAKRERE